jgi:hypothetical protein
MRNFGTGSRKKGLQPSEIKDRDERLSGALDFIHPLGKKQSPGFPGKPGFSLWGIPDGLARPRDNRRTNGKMNARLT